MRSVSFPTFAKWRGGLPSVEAHSRGGAGLFGHEAYELAGGARVVWSFEVVSMKTSDALKFRAFLHSLRGSSGSFTIGLPPANRSFTVSAYSDDTLHSDDTPYADGGAAYYGTTSASASSGANSMTVTGFTPTPGEWMQVVTASGNQTVHVSGVSGSTVTFRPAIRAAVASGAAVVFGAPPITMRLIGATPVLSLVNGYSKPLTLDCEEFY